LIGKVINP